MDNRIARQLRRSGCLVLFFIAAFLFSGCASYSSRVREARGFFEAGNYEVAAEKLKPLVEKKDNDYLLYLMDLGMVYHASGKYEEATQTLLKAAAEAEIRDYTSIGAEAASVLLSDEVKAYKGEHFEVVLVHLYLAIDFTLMGKWDDALVECRKVNHILEQMIQNGKLKYQQNAFAKYLAALLFESQREYNDAFVDYRTLVKWAPGFPYLGGPLKRVADKLQASQELAEYKKMFPEPTEYRLTKNAGELVVVVEQGRIPVKVPHPNFSLLPKFRKRHYNSDHFVLRAGSGSDEARTHTLYDIEATAIRELDERVGGIMAKKIAGVVAKQVIAQQVAKQTKNSGLGALTGLLLHATDSADLRSWTTLPAKLQLVRLTLPAGRHDIALDMVAGNGAKAQVKQWSGVEVRAGKTIILNHRYFD